MLARALVLALVVFPGLPLGAATGGFTPRPALLDELDMDGVSVGPGGTLECRNVRWEGDVEGIHVEARAALLVLAVPARGARVDGLTLRAVWPRREASALPEPPAFPAEGPVPALDESGAPPRRPVDAIWRALGAGDRLGRLVGPLDVTSGTVEFVYGTRTLARLEALTGTLATSAAEGTPRATLSAGLALARPTGLGPVAGPLTIQASWGPAAPAELTLALRGALGTALAETLDLPVRAIADGTTGLASTLTVARDGSVTLRGTLDVRGLTLRHDALAEVPIELGHVSGGFAASADGALDRLAFGTTGASFGKARADVSVTLARDETGLQIEGRLDVPEQACEAILGGLPDGVLGELASGRWDGTAGFVLQLAVHTARARELRLTMEGSLEPCVPRTLGWEVDDRLAELSGDFRLPVSDPQADGDEALVGPGTPDFVPFELIPPHVRAAAIATEDRAFYEHTGVSVRLIQGALGLDLEKRAYFYGGSTITQQLVKNILLTREKTLARKIQEAILAREVERRLSKDRILELYLNCIEYGPRVYGIGAAARFYFGKDVDTLTPLEGAFLMALKPSPRTGFMVFRRGTLNPRWRKKLATILRRMEVAGAIDAATVAAAAPYQPDFLPFDPTVHVPYPKK